jgi:hypothetical protein
MEPVTYTYDAVRITHVIRDGPPPAGTDGEPKREDGTDPNGGEPVTTYMDPADPASSPAPPPFRFEHDPKAAVFRLTTAEGTVEVWRDNPVRFLCVEPDPETGAMRPVVKRGRPVYLHLCREEREAR